MYQPFWTGVFSDFAKTRVSDSWLTKRRKPPSESKWAFSNPAQKTPSRIRRTPVNCSPSPTSPSRLFVGSPPKPFAYAYNADKKRPPAGFRLENPAGGRITTSVAWKSDLRRDGRMQCQHHAGMVPERIGDWLGAMPVDGRRAMRTGNPARIAYMQSIIIRWSHAFRVVPQGRASS